MLKSVKTFFKPQFLCFSLNYKIDCAQELHIIMNNNRPKVFIDRVVSADDLQSMQELKKTFDIQCATETLATKAEVLQQVKGVYGIVVTLTQTEVDRQVLDTAGPNLKVVSTGSMGVDHIDIAECKRRNIVVTNVRDESVTNATADMAMTLLLATARKLCQGVRAVSNGEWGNNKDNWMWGRHLQGSTIGIVGLGRIGSTIAKRLQAFDVGRILYFSRNESRFAKTVSAELVDFETLLKESDFVIASCSYNDQSKFLFDKEAFSLMKNTAVFVNVCRGGVVNQVDLYEALANHEIWAAGLDVTTPEPISHDDPLLKLSNCIISPHLGLMTEFAAKTRYDHAFKNLLAVFNNEAILSKVC